MFWGLIMEPERRYTQKVENSFRITMAAIDISESNTEPAQIMCTYEGRNYLLCTLKKPDLLQCSLDLEFSAGTEVSFAANGSAHIHLTGYLIENDIDGLTVDDLEEQEEEEEEEYSQEIEEEVKEKKKRQKKKSSEEPKSKKLKLSNGSVSQEDLEEEESDDPDFEGIEGEADDSDESDDGEEDNEEEAEQEESAEEEVVEVKKSKKQKKLEAKTNGDLRKSSSVEPQQNKQKKTLEKGVVIEELIQGSGPVAKPGKFVNVYYEGRLQKNNKMFDSMGKGPGFKFRLGSGEVIKGWDIGVAGMKVGGKRKIICPPNTAYGPKGSPPAIPPNSTLVFTVELKKVN